jgi:hypothetical protein
VTAAARKPRGAVRPPGIGVQGWVKEPEPLAPS